MSRNVVQKTLSTEVIGINRFDQVEIGFFDAAFGSSFLGHMLTTLILLSVVDTSCIKN